MASARMYAEMKMMSNFFNDNDLDEIERTVHEHTYKETVGGDPEGKRVFRCIECGHIRRVTPGSLSNPYQNMLPGGGVTE